MPSLITILLQRAFPHCGSRLTIAAVGVGAGADADAAAELDAAKLDAAIDISASLSAKWLISACCNWMC